LNISIQGLLGWIFGISIIVGLFALAISFAIWAVKLLIGMIA